MYRLPLSICTTAILVFAGLAAHEANAQPVQQPRQDCSQAVGIQPQPSVQNPQDQSCNTVFKDPDLLDATVNQLIQRLVEASPSLGDGPYVRIDLDPNDGPTHLDYVTKFVSANNSQNFSPITVSVAEIQSQLGASVVPQGDINVEYTLSSAGGGMNKLVLRAVDPDSGNQIINECPDGVMLFKNGGQNQTVTAFGEVDMWYNTTAGDPESAVECGLTVTSDLAVNVIGLFFLAGPSGLFTTQNITDTCADFNSDPNAQHAQVAFVTAGHPETGDSLIPPTNLSACVGSVSYCDFDEAPGLFNACYEGAFPPVGPLRARSQSTQGAPFPTGGAAVQALGISIQSSGTDTTSSFSGTKSSGQIFSFP